MIISIISLFKILAVAPTLPAKCPKHPFFGLQPWYHYLPKADFSVNGCSISIMNFTFLPGHGNSDIPLVLLAIIDDLLRIAGLVAIGFIVYGGFQYVASQGSSDKTARAQNTITDALIGLGVAIIAISIVSFLGDKLGG